MLWRVGQAAFGGSGVEGRKAEGNTQTSSNKVLPRRGRWGCSKTKIGEKVEERQRGGLGEGKEREGEREEEEDDKEGGSEVFKEGKGARE